MNFIIVVFSVGLLFVLAGAPVLANSGNITAEMLKCIGQGSDCSNDRSDCCGSNTCQRDIKAGKLTCQKCLPLGATNCNPDSNACCKDLACVVNIDVDLDTSKCIECKQEGQSCFPYYTACCAGLECNSTLRCERVEKTA